MMKNAIGDQVPKKGKWFVRETIGESLKIVLVFTIVQNVIQAGRGILFARLLGPSGYGILTLGFFFIPLAVGIVKLGIPSSYSRYVQRFEQRGELGSFFLISFAPIVLLGVAVTVAGMLLLPELSYLLFGDESYRMIMAACILAVLPAALYEAARGAFTGMRSLKLSSLTEFSQFILFSAAGLAILLATRSPAGVLFAYAGSLLVVTVGAGILLASFVDRIEKKHEAVSEPAFLRRLFRFSIWFMINPMVTMTLTYTDRWMLNRMLSAAEVGIYSVAVNIAGMIFIFGMIAGRVTMPNLSVLWEQGKRTQAMELINASIKVNTLLLAMAATGVYLVREPLVLVLYGENYRSAIPVLSLLLIFKLVSSILWTAGGYAQLVEKTYIPLVCNIAGVIGNITLNLLLIPRYGIAGAAVATTISFGIVLLLTFFWFSRLGMRFSPSALAVAALPILFLLPSALAAGAMGLFIAVTVATEFIFSRTEKERLLGRFGTLVRGRR